jgi:hypothetical protein
VRLQRPELGSVESEPGNQGELQDRGIRHASASGQQARLLRRHRGNRLVRDIQERDPIIRLEPLRRRANRDDPAAGRKSGIVWELDACVRQADVPGPFSAAADDTGDHLDHEIARARLDHDGLERRLAERRPPHPVAVQPADRPQR